MDERQPPLQDQCTLLNDVSITPSLNSEEKVENPCKRFHLILAIFEFMKS